MVQFRTVWQVCMTAAMCLGIAACGFKPLHQEESLVDDRLASILVMPIADRSGQIMHNMLRDELNPHGMPAEPSYKLLVTISSLEQGVGGSSAVGTASKALLHTAKYKLLDARNDREIFTGEADSRIYFAAYNLFYDDQPSRENAERNGLRSLSREISHDLASLFVRDTR